MGPLPPPLTVASVVVSVSRRCGVACTRRRFLPGASGTTRLGRPSAPEKAKPHAKTPRRRPRRRRPAYWKRGSAASASRRSRTLLPSPAAAARPLDGSASRSMAVGAAILTQDVAPLPRRRPLVGRGARYVGRRAAPPAGPGWYCCLALNKTCPVPKPV